MMGKIKGTIEIDRERCKGCAVCAQACPLSLISMSDEVNAKGYNYATMDSADCTGCASCGIVCPDSCITIFRALREAD